MTATTLAAPTVVLPDLDWVPTTACGTRNGAEVVRVVTHRWGALFTTEPAEARSYQGVINEFENPANKASAHVVFPGSAAPGKATQMIPWSEMAWTEADYNPTSVEVESADAIWLGDDPKGFQELARIVAFLLATGGGTHKPFDGHQLPPVWSAEKGFCRHADLGAAGGGHLQCPTTDLHLWHLFVLAVQHETAIATSGVEPFRPTWGRG